jgi:RND family efflux transporter MFP subunit
LGAVAALAALSLSACHEKPKTAEAKDTHLALVEVATAGAATVPVVITGSGTVSAWQEAPVGAETGGLTAVALLVDEGQYVTQGQPLLRMNDAVLQAQLKQAQAQLMSAKAQQAQAENDYRRYKELADKGFISASGLDAKLAQQQTAAAGVATAQATVQEVSTRLSQATVRAPVSGLITSRTAVQGQIVGAGDELFRIARDNRIELNMEVVETELAMLKAGMPATVRGETSGPIAGSVRIVTPMVSNETRLGYARVSIPADAGLKPGMFARGEVNVGNQPVVTVPQKAVIYQANVPATFVVGANNKVALRKLKTGERLGDNVVVTEGVAEGERVVTAGAGFLVDGDTVRIKGPQVATEQKAAAAKSGAK